MKCPFCGFPDSKVTDSRPKDNKIRRRRECTNCGARFTTFEIVEKPMLMVEKRSGSYEEFNRRKLITGIFNAIKKRPVPIEQVERIADNIENYFANELRTVARSKEIGELVLAQLKEIDSIAYIRFASVYEDFTDVKSFVAIIDDIGGENAKALNDEDHDTAILSEP